MQPTNPIVTCPGCLIAMATAATEALPMRLMKMTFRCSKCGTETVRFFKSKDPAQLPATPEPN
jgi:DNA replicative helicase MCM subunit Mcm2 (Cdc46/Mcm family)